jgi:hypothetical protein
MKNIEQSLKTIGFDTDIIRFIDQTEIEMEPAISHERMFDCFIFMTQLSHYDTFLFLKQNVYKFKDFHFVISRYSEKLSEEQIQDLKQLRELCSI